MARESRRSSSYSEENSDDDRSYGTTSGSYHSKQEDSEEDRNNQDNDEADVDNKLMDMLVKGLVLQTTCCPTCETPLVKMMMYLKGQRPDIKGVRSAESIDLEKPDEPIFGVPFCVSCTAHVVTEKAERKILEDGLAYDQLLRDGHLIDTTQQADDEGSTHTPEHNEEPEAPIEQELNDAEDDDNQDASIPKLEDFFPAYEKRREVATKLLGSKMLKGYSLRESQCDRCEMPQMAEPGTNTVVCVVCPNLDKKAMKKMAKYAEKNGLDLEAMLKASTEPNQPDEKNERKEFEQLREKQHNLLTEQLNRAEMRLNINDAYDDNERSFDLKEMDKLALQLQQAKARLEQKETFDIEQKQLDEIKELENQVLAKRLRETQMRLAQESHQNQFMERELHEERMRLQAAATFADNYLQEAEEKAFRAEQAAMAAERRAAEAEKAMQAAKRSQSRYAEQAHLAEMAKRAQAEKAAADAKAAAAEKVLAQAEANASQAAQRAIMEEEAERSRPRGRGMSFDYGGNDVDWETKQYNGRKVLANRILTGWSLFPEYCQGAMCNDSPLIGKGNKIECVICGGSGNGMDGAYGANDDAMSFSSKRNRYHVPDSAGFDHDYKRRNASKEVGKRLMEGWELVDTRCQMCNMSMLAEPNNGPEMCIFCDDDIEYATEDDNMSRGSRRISLELPEGFDVSDTNSLARFIQATQERQSPSNRSLSSRGSRRMMIPQDPSPRSMSRSNSFSRPMSAQRQRAPAPMPMRPMSRGRVMQQQILPPRPMFGSPMMPESRSGTPSRRMDMMNGRSPTPQRNIRPNMVIQTNNYPDDASYLSEDDQSAVRSVASFTLDALMDKIADCKTRGGAESALLVEKLSAAASAVRRYEMAE